MTDKIQNSFSKLSDYCVRESFKGYDPYDGLNSVIFKSIPFLSKNRLVKLAWTQAFKRSPVNLRLFLGVKKDFNPKALGLFLSGYCNLYKITPKEEYLDKINFFTDKIKALQNKKWSGTCWGYNFDWQARAFFQPKYSPTVVATVFIGRSLIDAFEVTGDYEFIKIARSACDFVLRDLNRHYDEKGNFAFSYSPLDNGVVFNASFLASILLARVYSITNEPELLEAARKSVIFCCDHQRLDGSWSYGKEDYQQWVDNFHTGFNLECLAGYMKFSGDKTCEEFLIKGFDYYIKTFFTDEGAPKYYSNSIYPIDVHSSAQAVITLSKLSKFKDYSQLAVKVLHWTIDNMQSDKGYFYYQINKFFSTRIPYMRWSQAWMFYALSEYLLCSQNNNSVSL
jgi:rhamnogalacturonyl hydrolase YesR